MPKILERLVSQLMEKGMDRNKAYAVATSQLQKHGTMKKGSQELTEKGKTRDSMSASERAIDRQSKYSGKPKSAFIYSPKTNRATLRKK
jgi:hypothetical protein